MRHSNGKRSRGRSGRRPAPQQNINRAYDSNGPAGKLRGTAAQLVEKYVGLARDARVGRDRVLVENFLQHAEHYQRIMNEIMIAQGIEPEAIDDDEQGGYDDQPDGNYDANGNFNGNGQGNYNDGQGNGNQNNGNQNNGNQGYNQRQNNGGGGNQGNGGQNNGNQGNYADRGDRGDRQNNGGGQGNNQRRDNGNQGNYNQRRDNGGNAPVPQAQPQPIISGVEDQPEISPDVAVEVPPVSLTPAPLPSAPRAIRSRRPRRTAAAIAAEEGQPASAPVTENSDSE